MKQSRSVFKEIANATENWKMEKLYLNVSLILRTDPVNDKNFLSIFACDLLKTA